MIFTLFLRRLTMGLPVEELRYFNRDKKCCAIVLKQNNYFLFATTNAKEIALQGGTFDFEMLSFAKNVS